MTKFKIKAWTGHAVKIEVATTRKEFQERAKKYYKLPKSSVACCFYKTDKKDEEIIGEIMFWAGDLTVGTIAHEFMHIATGLMTKTGWTLLKTETNEDIAENFGKMVGDCCKKLSKLGHKIEFTR